MKTLPAKGASPLFSLLIGTFGRIDPLRALLAGLTEQSCRDFEILIADQNPPGFLTPLLAEFENTLPVRTVSMPGKGLSRARNALLAQARGAFIAFPDDDCRYMPNTLERAHAFFAANPHAHALVGQWRDPAASGEFSLRRSGRVVSRFLALRCGTLVQFYRRAVTDAVGGFDPELGPGAASPYGGGEDTDYLLRALAAGFTAVYAPDVRMWHPDISRNPPSPEKVRSYSLGRMYLLRKHNFSLWFKLINVAYPLLRMPLEGKKAWEYRKTMFLARLAGLFAETK